MSRQSITWLVLLGVLGILLAGRSFIGQGMGRVYVKDVHNAYVQANVPALGESTAPAKASWVEASSADAEDFATAEQQANIKEWTSQEIVEPKKHFADPSGSYISWSKTIGLWLAAIFTLAIFSFLYKDNPFYKVAESCVVGVSAAYGMVVGFWTMIMPNLVGKLAPSFVAANFVPGLEGTSTDYWYIIPAIFGVLMLMRLSPKGGWLSLWTLGFIVGTTAALRMVHYIETDFLSQMRSTILPLWQVVETNGQTDVYSSIWASIRNLTIIVGVLTCLTYFFFSFEHKGAVGRVARVGIWFLMITFGAAFGFTVMGRIALLAARFEFLFDDWLWFIDPMHQRTLAAAASMIGF